MKIFAPLTFIACSLAFVSVNTHAAVAETDTPSTSISDGTEAFDGNISTTGDLIYGLTGTAVASTGPNQGQPISAGIDFQVSGLNDGIATSLTDGNDTFWGTTPFDNLFGTGGNALEQDPQVTFNLNTSVNTLGYTISSVQSIFGFTNSYSFADQNYTVQYTTVGDSTWQTLATVAYDPFAATGAVQFDGTQIDGTSSDVSLAVTGVQGVNAIRFTFTPYVDTTTGQEQLGQVIREIEVDGVATPEPGTWAMMFAGLGLLLLVGRLRVRQNS